MDNTPSGDDANLLDITPAGDNANLMDPYELFSTPPSELVLSSTPNKPTKGSRRAPNSARKAVLTKRAAAANARASISFDSGSIGEKSSLSINTSVYKANTSCNKPKSSTTTRVLRNRNINKSKSADCENRTNRNINSKQAPKQRVRKQQSDNVWDKCLKTNPELAQFVDNFNQSLEEALKKPLDMSEAD